MPVLLRSAVVAIAIVCVVAAPSFAELSGVFDDIFTEFLDKRLQLSPGSHADHYLDAADLATAELSPALSTLIAGNISSFPLTSTIAGVSFDFSSGAPVSVQESLGPIFAETAETIGQGNINVGVNYTYLNLKRFRGMRLEDLRFTFLHEDLGAPGLGDDPNESDTIDMRMGMDVDASILAFFGTYGLLDNLDIGVAVPIVTVSLSGTAVATANSATFQRFGFANHSFGPDGADPVLESQINYDESATGLGDVSVRLKYGTSRGDGVFYGALVDVRLPTGEENDFHGTGESNVKLAAIASKSINDFTPHVNLGYDIRGGESDSDEFEFTAGFDQKVYRGVTFAADIIGEFDVSSDDAIELFPGSETIVDRNISSREVSLSNVPDEDSDHRVDASIGFRIAPSDNFIFLANVLVPMNNGGLRSTVAPTVGVSMNF